MDEADEVVDEEFKKFEKKLNDDKSKSEAK